MDAVAHAHSIVTALGAGGGSGAWRLDRAAVAERLHELVAAPARIRQGRLNLCGPAALFTLWLRRDPVAAVTYAAQLFEEGAAEIGSLAVRPSVGLRELRYDDADDGGRSPQADWMMMAALRDSSNRTLRYARQGGVREAAAAITMPGAVARWLRATGLFSTVRDETNLVLRKGVRHAEGLEPSPGRDVVSLVALEMFRRPPSALGRARDVVVALVPNHWVVLRSPVTRVGEGRVAFRFWSWGADHTAVMTGSRFRRCYFGSLMADVSKTPLPSTGTGA